MDAFDTTRPNIARVYDYWLGGKDNFVADRELAAAMTEVNPGIPAMARANRAFVVAAVGKAASAGISQFVDLGAGLPTHPAVHEAARAVCPDARVVYVDHDRVVAMHARALLATMPGIHAVEADITRPDEVIAHPQLAAAIDWAEPVAVVLAAILHFRDAATAGRLVAAYAAATCAGSHLAISVFSGRDDDMEAEQPGDLHRRAVLGTQHRGCRPVAGRPRRAAARDLRGAAVGVRRAAAPPSVAAGRCAPWPSSLDAANRARGCCGDGPRNKCLLRAVLG